MYGLSIETDVSFLINRELIQVCIGLYQVILNFDESVSISLECDFEHLFQNETLIENNTLPTSASTLLKLLGAKISDINNQGNGNLELVFSNDSVLRIFDSNEDEESYQIVFDGKEIVV